MTASREQLGKILSGLHDGEQYVMAQMILERMTVTDRWAFLDYVLELDRTSRQTMRFWYLEMYNKTKEMGVHDDEKLV